jgi:hypothetical protein
MQSKKCCKHSSTGSFWWVDLVRFDERARVNRSCRALLGLLWRACRALVVEGGVQNSHSRTKLGRGSDMRR